MPEIGVGQRAIQTRISEILAGEIASGEVTAQLHPSQIVSLVTGGRVELGGRHSRRSQICIMHYSRGKVDAGQRRVAHGAPARNAPLKSALCSMAPSK